MTAAQKPDAELAAMLSALTPPAPAPDLVARIVATAVAHPQQPAAIAAMPPQRPPRHERRSRWRGHRTIIAGVGASLVLASAVAANIYGDVRFELPEFARLITPIVGETVAPRQSGATVKPQAQPVSPPPAAASENAGAAETGAAADAPPAAVRRAVRTALVREAVRQHAISKGVAPEVADARIAEVEARIRERIEALPPPGPERRAVLEARRAERRAQFDALPPEKKAAVRAAILARRDMLRDAVAAIPPERRAEIEQQAVEKVARQHAAGLSEGTVDGSALPAQETAAADPTSATAADVGAGVAPEADVAPR